MTFRGKQCLENIVYNNHTKFVTVGSRALTKYTLCYLSLEKVNAVYLIAFPTLSGKTLGLELEFTNCNTKCLLNILCVENCTTFFFYGWRSSVLSFAQNKVCIYLKLLFSECDKYELKLKSLICMFSENCVSACCQMYAENFCYHYESKFHMDMKPHALIKCTDCCNVLNISYNLNIFFPNTSGCFNARHHKVNSNLRVACVIIFYTI